MTQNEARQRVAQLRRNHQIVIVGAIPLNSWGGCERSWGVYEVRDHKYVLIEQ